MTVAEFIEWLQTQDQLATVCVLRADTRHMESWFLPFEPDLATHIVAGDTATLELGIDRS